MHWKGKHDDKITQNKNLVQADVEKQHAAFELHLIKKDEQI
jgi:hypothetical protein